MGRVDGAIAMVTGAARGIGAEAARTLGREGAKVLLTDVIEDEGAAVAQEINDAGGTAVFQPHDVLDEARWEQLTTDIAKQWGPLTVLVNNAGIVGCGEYIEDMALSDWRRVTGIDLDAVFLGCKYGIRAMKEKGGSIINISSIYGIVGGSKTADYNASKGGVRLLTKCAALECAELQYPIRVNSVHPGFIQTPLIKGAVERSLQKGEIETETEIEEQILARQPIGRWGQPTDIANAILFLASDESAFMLGSEMVVDGGCTAH